MQGWDFSNNSGGSSEKKTEFATFPEGLTRIQLLDPAPHVRWVHWMPASTLKGVTGKGRSVTCPGRGCPICEIRKQQKANKENYSYGMSRRFAINIYNLDKNRVEVAEQGVSFFEDIKGAYLTLKDENDKEGEVTLPLMEYEIKVRRTGTTKDDTTYRNDIGKQSKLDTSSLEKTDLNTYFSPATPEQILRLLQGEEWNNVFTSGDADEEVEVE